MQGVERKPIPVETAMNIIHDVFVSAAEREIHTGDAIHFNIITKVCLFSTDSCYNKVQCYKRSISNHNQVLKMQACP